MLDHSHTARHLTFMMIYKIFRSDEWNAFHTKGETLGAAVDLNDGFIHFSTACQVTETVTKHFTGEDDLKLLAIDPNTLGDALKWEVSRGGDLFPHFYGKLRSADVIWAKALRLADGQHQFPEGMV